MEILIAGAIYLVLSFVLVLVQFIRIKKLDKRAHRLHEKLASAYMELNELRTKNEFDEIFSDFILPYVLNAMKRGGEERKVKPKKSSRSI